MVRAVLAGVRGGTEAKCKTMAVSSGEVKDGEVCERPGGIKHTLWSWLGGWHGCLYKWGSHREEGLSGVGEGTKRRLEFEPGEVSC